MCKTRGAAALALALLLLGALPVRGELRYIVTQGSNTFQVKPISRFEAFDLHRATNDKTGYIKYLADFKARVDDLPGTLDDGNLYYYQVTGKSVPIEEYYLYGVNYAASADTGLELPNLTQLLLYAENQSRKLYLVIIHDIPNDPTGGSADFSFTGLPPTTYLAVEDDPGEGFTLDAAAGTLTANWTWSPCCTDGLAMGGLEYQTFCIDIDFTIGPEITALRWFSHDLRNPRIFPMDLNQPIRICTEGPAGFTGVDPILTANWEQTRRTVRLSWSYGDIESLYVVDPVATIVKLDRPCILADGMDQAIATVSPMDQFANPLGVGFLVNLDPASLQPGALSGWVIDQHNGVYSQVIVSDTAGSGTIVVDVEGTTIQQQPVLRFKDTLPMARFAAPATVQDGQQVCFTNLTPDDPLNQYNWDFETDGSVDDTSREPCHTYPAPGQYWATLEVVYDNDCDSTDSHPIQVKP